MPDNFVWWQIVSRVGLSLLKKSGVDSKMALDSSGTPMVASQSHQGAFLGLLKLK